MNLLMKTYSELACDETRTGSSAEKKAKRGGGREEEGKDETVSLFGQHRLC